MAERLRELRETFSFHLKKNDSEIVLAFAFKFIGREKVYNLLIKSLVGEHSAAGSMARESEASLPPTCCVSLDKPSPPRFKFFIPGRGDGANSPKVSLDSTFHEF